MFERLRAALDGALAGGDPGSLAQMREAVIEARVAVGEMRDAGRLTRAELARGGEPLSHAERRGRPGGGEGRGRAAKDYPAVLARVSGRRLTAMLSFLV